MNKEKDNILDLKNILSSVSIISFDTETTGLDLHLDDRMFSFSIASVHGTLYCDLRLSNDEPIDILKKFFANPKNVAFMHNAKFDMAALYHIGIECNCYIFDTEVLFRVLYNTLESTTLEVMAKHFGMEKNKEVEIYIKEKNLYRTKKNLAGIEKRIPCYNDVPYDTMSKYAQEDARITFNCAIKMLTDLKQLVGPDYLIIENEYTKTLFNMEKEGILIDVEYTKKQYEEKEKNIALKKQEFKELSGLEFCDSRKTLEQSLSKQPEDLSKITRTAKGNLSFAGSTLERLSSPIGAVINSIRKDAKIGTTYFFGLLSSVSENGKIHPSYRQAKTKTRRLSCTNPPMQTIPKDVENSEDELTPYSVRHCFTVPENNQWLSIDYEAMEYKMLFDIANQEDVIEQIKNGLDPHQATANLLNVSRKEAKTINFSILYGSGVATLCGQLFSKEITISNQTLQALWMQYLEYGITTQERILLDSTDKDSRYKHIELLLKTNETRKQYFGKLPKVKNFITSTINEAKTKGQVFNWAGARYLFDSKSAYKSVNYAIQGGAAEVIKRAMIKIDKNLTNKKTKMILQVHDELNFYLHNDEQHLIEEIKKEMTSAYPHKSLHLTVKATVFKKGWNCDN